MDGRKRNLGEQHKGNQIAAKNKGQGDGFKMLEGKLGWQQEQQLFPEKRNPPRQVLTHRKEWGGSAKHM